MNWEDAKTVIAHQSSDPIRKAHAQSPGFTWCWLRDGEKLTILQRAGYTVFSILWFAFGLTFLQVAAEDFRSRNLFFAFGFGAAATVLLTFSILGFRNMLRFAAPPRETQQGPSPRPATIQQSHPETCHDPD